MQVDTGLNGVVLASRAGFDVGLKTPASPFAPANLGHYKSGSWRPQGSLRSDSVSLFTSLSLGVSGVTSVSWFVVCGSPGRQLGWRKTDHHGDSWKSVPD